MSVCQSILEAIGRTPMVALRKIAGDSPVHFFAKFEATNPGGSIKDRVALAMIEDAEAKKLLKPGSTIVEATAGNTGVGLAMVAAIKGYRCVFCLPDKMSEDKINLLKAFGAEVVITATNVPPDSAESYNGVADRLAREIPGAYRPGQFTNLTNPEAHYRVTGPEIWKDMDGKMDAFVAGVGTGGTVSGVGRYLKEQHPSVKIVVADPEGSIISGSTPKPWKVEGIGEDFIPLTYDRQVVDDCVRVADRDSFAMARRLAREEGLLVGGSSGTAMAAALVYAERLPSGSNVVVLFPDTGRNYITRIFNDRWLEQEGFASVHYERTPLSEVMKRKSTPSLIAVNRSETVLAAIRLMHKHSISQLPVVDGDAVVGSLSEASIMKLLHDGLDLARQEVSAVMAQPFPLLDDTTDAGEAYRLLVAGHDALVVAHAGKPQAILAKIDLIDYWMRHHR